MRTQVALYLDDEQIALLDKLARKFGRTKQDLLREALNTLLFEYQMFKVPKRKTPGARVRTARPLINRIQRSSSGRKQAILT